MCQIISYSKDKEKDFEKLLEDYEEIPVDILTFVDDNYYLGNENN